MENGRSAALPEKYQAYYDHISTFLPSERLIIDSLKTLAFDTDGASINAAMISGFAEDRGFAYPKLNAPALEELKHQVADCRAGYSNSRTCGIGLSQYGVIDYNSIVYPIEQ